MKAIILVGGSGTRLRPVTYEIPKPLLPVRKRPILNHLIDFLKRHGVEEIALLAAAGHEEDFRRWQKTWDDVVAMDSLKIVYETKPMGTFGGILMLKDWLGGEDFIVSNGDELKDFSIQKLLDFHRSTAALETMPLVEVPDPHRYGVPTIEGSATAGKVIEINEKPENPVSNFVSSGFYIFNPQVFDHVDSSKEMLMTEFDVSPKIAAAEKLYAIQMEGSRWYDCGTLERWEKAMNEW